jgi:uncharacterized protein (TIGR00730 family)
MNRQLKSSRAITVFCGSKPGNDPSYMALAQQMGTLIAHQGYALVYGGGHTGLMGAVADAALAAGGEVIGVIPASLMEREVGHAALTRLEVVPDMAVRKERLISLADAFISMPGGLGTMDELFEVLSLQQLGYHNKPSAILNPAGFYDLLLSSVGAMANAGFLYEGVWENVVVEAEPQSLLRRLMELTKLPPQTPAAATLQTLSPPPR